MPRFRSWVRAPHRSADLGRRIRFVLYTAILVVLICVAASVLSPGSGGHHGHRARSSAHAAPRASIGDIGPVARTARAARRRGIGRLTTRVVNPRATGTVEASVPDDSRGEPTACP